MSRKMRQNPYFWKELRKERKERNPKGNTTAIHGISAPKGWYKGYYEIKMEVNLPAVVLEDMREYYTYLLSKYKDVLTVSEACKITGYGKTSINNWCGKGHLKAFKYGNSNRIPKVYFIEFLCSSYCRFITRKSDWHIRR